MAVGSLLGLVHVACCMLQCCNCRLERFGLFGMAIVAIARRVLDVAKRVLDVAIRALIVQSVAVGSSRCLCGCVSVSMTLVRAYVCLHSLRTSFITY